MTRTAVSWLARVIVSAILIQTLFFKFTAAAESVAIFERLGMEPHGRIGTGIVEAIAAILLLIPGRPALTATGAVLSLGVISGALLSHLTVLGISVQGDGGTLFILAVVVFVGSAITLWLHRSALVANLRHRFSRGRAAAADAGNSRS